MSIASIDGMGDSCLFLTPLSACELQEKKLGVTTDLAVPSTTGLAAIPVTGSLTNSTDGADGVVARNGDS